MGNLNSAPQAGTKFMTRSLPFSDSVQTYSPRRVALFEPSHIVLAKGCFATVQQRTLVEATYKLYPAAEVVERLDLPHNRIDLGTKDPLELHYAGKQTLVFGEHKSAVRLSQEQHNTCPNYWHFSPYGFCPYDCNYCYLAGTKGVLFSPTVKIFLNLPEILAQIDRLATNFSKPTAFYLGKLQDGLALDTLTGYSQVMVPFFARHPYARMTLLTKSAGVDNLLDLDHGGHTILSWSLNPESICAAFESNTPSLPERIQAMQKCIAAGYPVRAVIMPIIPVDGWQDIYTDFLLELLGSIRLDRITLGGLCSYPDALRLMESKLGHANVISQALNMAPRKSADGRSRYPQSLRLDMYSQLISAIRSLQPDLSTSLCLEERSVFEALDMTASLGRCNCVL